ncbi:hypothetical protein YWS52_19940 [Chitiniphilus shinanonensis]
MQPSSKGPTTRHHREDNKRLSMQTESQESVKYYSVDRSGGLAKDKQIFLEPNPDPNGNQVMVHINDMYPAGFSRHGMLYFREPRLISPSPEHQSGILELLLEATRKAYYPDKPCRYQSVFAWDSIEAADRFRTQYGKATDPIYELHPQAEVHRGDMALYALKDTFACVDHRLHLYWQEKTLNVQGYTAQWEYVLMLPVLVGSEIS